MKDINKFIKLVTNPIGYDPVSKVLGFIGISLLFYALYLVFKLKGWV